MFFLGCCCTALAAVTVGDGEGEFAKDVLAYATGTTYAAYHWLFRSCRWVRVHAGTLEWRTPLAHGRVPLHDVRRISFDSPRSAEIDFQGGRSLELPVRDGFEDLIAAIVAGAPHVVIKRPAPKPSPRRGRGDVLPPVRDRRPFPREAKKVTDPLARPEPVWVVDARLDERRWPGMLFGWGVNPSGGGAGRRGLVLAEGPDGAPYIGWALPEQLQQRWSPPSR